MKNLVNYVILSVAIVIAVLVVMSQGVNASGTVLFPSTTSNLNNTINNTADSSTSTEGDTSSTTTINNINSNVLKDNTVNTVNTVNVVNRTTTNSTPSERSSNLPQTGENDVYIVTAVGAIALVIGTVAYFKSRKYDV